MRDVNSLVAQLLKQPNSLVRAAASTVAVDPYAYVQFTYSSHTTKLTDIGMSYGRLKLPSSGSVHFMHADFFPGKPQEAVDDLESAGIRCEYVDYRDIEPDDLHVANAIAQKLNLMHAPYQVRTSPVQVEIWVPFLDDLIDLSESEKGIVLFIDNADMFLSKNSRGMFRLIEAFQTQVHHWMEKSKPCHLCFQMEPNDALKLQFLTA